jgi:hypothetical protein
MADVEIRQPVPLRTIHGVELAAVGTWKASTGQTTFTTEDFAHAVSALDCPGVRNPVIKLGHAEEDAASGVRWDGEPAVGWVAGMRLGDDGKLRGDFTGMPSWLADPDGNGLSVLASAYPDRSIEIHRPFVCQIGHTHPSVITAVALLGVSAPGVGVLKSMQDVYAAFTEPAASSTPTAATARLSTSVNLAAPGRDLSDTERQATTDFAALDQAWQAALDDLLAQWPDVAAAQREELAAQITAAVDDNPDRLGDLSVTSAAGAALIAAALIPMAAAAASEQVVEARRQGAPEPDPVEPDPDALEAVAAGVAAAMAAGTAAYAGRTAAQLLGTGPGADIAERTTGKLDDLGDRFLRDQLGGALSAAQSVGRISALRVLPTGHYYASEIGDSNACSPCQSIDGAEFDDLSAAESAYGSGKYAGCLAGARCRGQLVTVWDVVPDLAEAPALVARGLSATRVNTTAPSSTQVPPGLEPGPPGPEPGDAADLADQITADHGTCRPDSPRITVRLSIGDTMPAPAPAAVKASVSVEEISRKYYESAGYSTWITAMHVDPLELVTTDDATGKFYRVPVEMDAKGAFSFGDPQEVAIVYQDVKSAASALPYRWGSRKVSLLAAGKDAAGQDLPPGPAPTPKAEHQLPPADAIKRVASATIKTPDATPATGRPDNAEEATNLPFDAAKYREAFGLPDGLSDDEVKAQALAALSPPPSTPETKTDGAPSDLAAMLAVIPKDGSAIVVDKDNYAQLVKLAKRGDQAYEAMKRGERDTYLSAACKVGRFPVSRLQAYKDMWDRNPDETRAYVELMPANSVPVVAAGAYGADVDMNEADMAYAAMYPGTER